MRIIFQMALAMLFSLNSSAVLYKNDSLTRFDSTPLQASSVAYMRGTLFFITPTIAVTAKHVNTSGFVMFNDEVGFTTTTIEESNVDQGLDYKLVGVSWGKNANGEIVPATCPAGTRLLNKISNFYDDKDLKLSRIISQKIEVYGFPKDRARVTTSLGDKIILQAGENDPKLWEIYFNAGVVSGNSGGPILDSEGKLLGIVTGGTSASFEPEFDPYDYMNFNSGISIRAIYLSSPTFKKVIDANSILTADSFCQ